MIRPSLKGYKSSGRTLDLGLWSEPDFYKAQYSDPWFLDGLLKDQDEGILLR